MKRVLLFFIFAIGLLLVRAQSFSNLGFEYWQSAEYPLRWQPLSMIISSDSVTKLHGKYSLKCIRMHQDVEKDKTPYGIVLQYMSSTFNYSELKNKKVDVSVKVRVNPADTSVHAGAFIQIIDTTNPKNGNLSIGNDVTSAISGGEWIESKTSITFKELTPDMIIYMGGIMLGHGECWMDDYQIELNGNPAKDTYPRITNLTDKEKQWLQTNLIPVSEDLQIEKDTFIQELGGARIVGVGDNVHGSASVVKLKNMVSRALIESGGFTLLTIEESPGMGELINQYIQGNSETLRWNDMNIMYNNDDFRGFAEWLREYNKYATKKVSVLGVDINARYEDMIEEINKSTSRKYVVQLDSIRSIYKKCIRESNTEKSGVIRGFTDGQKLYVMDNLKLIKQELVKRDPNEWRTILLTYYLDNLPSYLQFSRSVREKKMADNITWLFSHFSGEKIIYLAHNNHVSNRNFQERSTGYWLKERFKEDYYIMGTCYFDGIDLYKKSALLNGRSIIDKSLKGSYEYLFSQVDRKCFFLNLNRVPANRNPANEWLTQPMLMRNYGVEPFNYYNEFDIINIIREYDGVLFIKRSQPIVYGGSF